MANSIAGLGRLERVELRAAWASESGDFTPWLAQEDNIRLLGEAIGIELEVEAEEKNVGPFRADILCKDLANGNWVLIENQLERTDHSHLGQLITYAAGLHAVTIVWIAAKFTEEHRAAMDWLNEVTGEDILFFALEVELWRIGSSPMAPKFNIVSSPNDWTRSVSDARKVIEQGALTESGQRYVEFWTYFGERIKERKSSLRIPKPNRDYWKTYSVGRSEFIVSAQALARDEFIAVQLGLLGLRAKRRYQELMARRAEVELALGTPLDWRELPDRKESQIRLSRHGMDMKDQKNWPAMADWLIEWTEKFQSVFRRIAKEVDIEEDGSPEDVL
ncbi:hypothetical protein Pan44_39970 [Caulifigura coniformis]|uniref:DUF4268 domain-containing protein n=1 Tax=Caulifigura coniformis TaxID=2527983 RepID=A0A517SIL9_9PLAN|nr:DUF4268 domain-containing protein [Caulifigura coniformis]QDT55949.1 hypothetical protein Pan44_39970 [Caulifigura coniformis]